jgi:hypothetical protein
MRVEEAKSTIEKLILHCLANGIFKDFETLDKVRESFNYLADMAAVYEYKIEEEKNLPGSKFDE